jgi:rhamnose transport system substrate-binding protein
LSKRIWLLAVMVVALVFGVAACGGDDSSSSGGGGGAASSSDSGKSLDIAFLPKAINNPYFDTAAKGAQQAATDLGGKFKQVGPSEANAAQQVPFINTLTQQNVSAIAVSANDPNALVPSLKRAMQSGIKVVSYDSDVAPEGRQLFVNQATADSIAQIQVKLISDQVGPSGGEIAILSAASTATNQNAWIATMKEELKKPEYSKLKLVKIAYGNDDDQKSFAETNGLLQAYPNLKGIISPTTVGVAAAARALESKKSDVKLTGLGTPNQMRKFVKDGTVESFALWDPGKLGELAYYAAAALVKGDIKGEPGEKFAAGDLGEYTIGDDKSIVLGPPTVFTKKNIDDFDF